MYVSKISFYPANFFLIWGGEVSGKNNEEWRENYFSSSTLLRCMSYYFPILYFSLPHLILILYFPFIPVTKIKLHKGSRFLTLRFQVINSLHSQDLRVTKATNICSPSSGLSIWSLRLGCLRLFQHLLRKLNLLALVPP